MKITLDKEEMAAIISVKDLKSYLDKLPDNLGLRANVFVTVSHGAFQEMRETRLNLIPCNLEDGDISPYMKNAFYAFAEPTEN